MCARTCLRQGRSQGKQPAQPDLWSSLRISCGPPLSRCAAISPCAASLTCIKVAGRSSKRQGQSELSRDQTRTLVEGSGVPTPHPRRPRVPTGPLTKAPKARSSETCLRKISVHLHLSLCSLGELFAEDLCAPEPVALFSGGTFHEGSERQS